MTSHHYLAGYYRTEDGSFEAGDLDIERNGNTFSCPLEGRLSARRYAEAPGVESIEITSERGAWRFVISDQEAARVGLAVE